MVASWPYQIQKRGRERNVTTERESFLGFVFEFFSVACDVVVVIAVGAVVRVEGGGTRATSTGIALKTRPMTWAYYYFYYHYYPSSSSSSWPPHVEVTKSKA